MNSFVFISNFIFVLSTVLCVKLAQFSKNTYIVNAGKSGNKMFKSTMFILLLRVEEWIGMFNGYNIKSINRYFILKEQLLTLLAALPNRIAIQFLVASSLNKKSLKNTYKGPIVYIYFVWFDLNVLANFTKNILPTAMVIAILNVFSNIII